VRGPTTFLAGIALRQITGRRTRASSLKKKNTHKQKNKKHNTKNNKQKTNTQQSKHQQLIKIKRFSLTVSEKLLQLEIVDKNIIKVTTILQMTP